MPKKAKDLSKNSLQTAMTDQKSLLMQLTDVDISSTTDFVVPAPEFVQKRPHQGRAYGEPPRKRNAPSIQLGAGFKWNLQALSQAANAVQSGGKSPVSALNELGVKVSYTILRQAGPPHCPSFTVAVNVADMKFEGHGNSKREARAAAARACLAALLARAGRVLGPQQEKDDFTKDMAEDAIFESMDVNIKQEIPQEPIVETTNTVITSNANDFTPPPPPRPSLFGSAAPAISAKSPINLLYENCPGLQFVCTFGDGTPLDSAEPPLALSHSMRFKVVCQVKETTFEGYGSSKKLAKLAAARSALASLDEAPPALDHAATVAPPAQHQTLYDRVAKLINEKFNELLRNDPVHSKRKVLAGIVITNDLTDEARVISVTTGTKCISGEHMSVRGLALNDCHAEVAARRALQRHLYHELSKYIDTSDPTKPLPHSDLEPCPGGGYQLKPHLRVHLYISTAPCGDGRIFSPHEPALDKHPNRLARGQLRTKIESGEGTIPVKNSDNVVQTWDGVMQGERLLTMSCSDKVARWCVAGLQGALLSLLVRPVYISCLVLGSLLHPHHMHRAVYGRIEGHLSALPAPFRLARPALAKAASAEPRMPARAPSFSVCWTCTDPRPEIVNATTGKLEDGQPSLLCKQSMFARWLYLVKRLPLLPLDADKYISTQVKLPENIDGILYGEAKMLCPAYQMAKAQLYEAFNRARLGRWVKKPIEQDQFCCEITNPDPMALFA